MYGVCDHERACTGHDGRAGEAVEMGGRDPAEMGSGSNDGEWKHCAATGVLLPLRTRLIEIGCSIQHLHVICHLRHPFGRDKARGLYHLQAAVHQHLNQLYFNVGRYQLAPCQKGGRGMVRMKREM